MQKNFSLLVLVRLKNDCRVLMTAALWQGWVLCVGLPVFYIVSIATEAD